MSLCIWWLQYKKHAKIFVHHRIHSECGPCYTERGLREYSLTCQMSGDWRGTLWTLFVSFCVVIIMYTETLWSLCIITSRCWCYMFYPSYSPVLDHRNYWQSCRLGCDNRVVWYIFSSVSERTITFRKNGGFYDPVQNQKLAIKVLRMSQNGYRIN
jgi:hypothetical protein